MQLMFVKLVVVIEFQIGRQLEGADPEEFAAAVAFVFGFDGDLLFSVFWPHP